MGADAAAGQESEAMSDTERESMIQECHFLRKQCEKLEDATRMQSMISLGLASLVMVMTLGIATCLQGDRFRSSVRVSPMVHIVQVDDSGTFPK